MWKKETQTNSLQHNKQRRTIHIQTHYSRPYSIRNFFFIWAASSGSTCPVLPSVPMGRRNSRTLDWGLQISRKRAGSPVLTIVLPSMTHMDSQFSPLRFRQQLSPRNPLRILFPDSDLSTTLTLQSRHLPILVVLVRKSFSIPLYNVFHPSSTFLLP